MKRTMRFKWVLFMAVAIFSISACGAEPATSTTESAQAVETWESSTTISTLPPSAQPTTDPDLVRIKEIGLSESEMVQIYNELKDGYDSASNPANGSNPDWDAVDVYETALENEIAKKHNIPVDDAVFIYWAGEFGKLNGETADITNLKIEHGKLVDATINGTTLIIKAKIEPSFTNSMTVDQNYYNVCDIIKNQGGSDFDTISYWAVADTQSGEEIKVISFDVPSNVIALVQSDNFAENTLGDYVDDLWILPSLRE